MDLSRVNTAGATLVSGSSVIASLTGSVDTIAKPASGRAVRTNPGIESKSGAGETVTFA